MKKVIFLFAVLSCCLISGNVFAQMIVELPSPGSLPVLQFVDQSTGFVAGAEGVWKTTNSGDNWFNVYDDSYVTDMEIVGLTGYAVTGRKIIKTTNGGDNWTVIFTWPQVELPNLTKVSTVSSDDVCVGYTGNFYYGQITPSRVLKSSDGGASWQTVFTGYGNDIRDMSFNSAREVCLVTDFAGSDTLWTFQNGQWFGVGCIFVVSTINNRDQGMIRLNGTEGGYPATIVTTNLGASWIADRIGPPEASVCKDLIFMNYQAYALISSYKIYRKNIGGTWEAMATLPEGYYAFERICCTQEYVFVTGVKYDSPNNATIIRYSRFTSGINETGGTVNQYKLNQNFPNPFNPSTTINYSIPKKSYVEIKIYDISGKEVAGVVSSIKEAGNHSVTFNGSNLSSGVYFYKLTADGFTSTKKMILLK